MENNIILFADSAATVTKVAAHTYRKQLVRYGSWVDPLYPSRKMNLNRAWAEQVKANFDKKVIDQVPVPDKHTSDTLANKGELVGMEVEDDGLYGLIEIRDAETARGIDEKRVFNCSISFDRDYVDTKEGNHHGPVVLHVALVNNPYLKKMSGFEKVKSAIKQMSEALAPAHTASAIMLSESEAKELQAMNVVTVKNDKKFDVTIKVKGDDGNEVEKVLKPGEEIDVPKDQSEAILGSIAEAKDPAEKKQDEETEDEKKARLQKEADDKKKADDEAAAKKAKEDEGKTPEQIKAEEDAKELSDLRKKDRVHTLSEGYEKLLRAGKVVPAQKESIMALAEVEQTTVSLSEGKTANLSELVLGILEAGAKQVEFDESGTRKGKKAEDEDDDKKKPSEKLSEDERAGLHAVGVRPETMDELAAKDPRYAEELKKIDDENKEK